MIIGLLTFSRASSVIVAVAAFWFLDTSINTYQAALRALLIDTVPEQSQVGEIFVTVISCHHSRSLMRHLVSPQGSALRWGTPWVELNLVRVS